MKQVALIVIICVTALSAIYFVTAPKQAEQSNTPVIDAIYGRRSIRQYKDVAVEREKLMKIAKAGVAAPNAMNSQAWAVRIVDSKEWIDASTAAFVESVKDTPLGEHLLTDDFKNMYRNAPAAIFVAAKPSVYAGVDCGLLGQNIMLAAYELGLGTCCLGSPVGFFNSEAGAPFLADLNLPEGYQLQYVIAVGYGDEQPEARPRDLDKIAFVE